MTDHDMPDILIAIDTERERQGLSFAALAERAGMSAPQVHNYLRGDKQPGIHQVERLAKAVGAELHLVISGRER